MKVLELQMLHLLQINQYLKYLKKIQIYLLLLMAPLLNMAKMMCAWIYYKKE